MGKRIAKTQEEWSKEASYIETTMLLEEYYNFNNDKECFDRYVLMQARFMVEDGYSAMANNIVRLLVGI